MKYFLVRADIRDGETDYADSFILKALDKNNAKLRADKEKNKYLGFGDYREVIIRGVTEISFSEVKIIERLGLSYIMPSK